MSNASNRKLRDVARQIVDQAAAAAPAGPDAGYRRGGVTRRRS
jgi:hypothetical protein